MLQPQECAPPRLPRELRGPSLERGLEGPGLPKEHEPGSWSPRGGCRQADVDRQPGRTRVVRSAPTWRRAGGGRQAAGCRKSSFCSASNLVYSCSGMNSVL